MRQVPLDRDINITVNGCSGFATSTQKGPFMAMLVSHSIGTYFIGTFRHDGGHLANQSAQWGARGCRGTSREDICRVRVGVGAPDQSGNQ